MKIKQKITKIPDSTPASTLSTVRCGGCNAIIIEIGYGSKNDMDLLQSEDLQSIAEARLAKHGWMCQFCKASTP